MAMVLPWSFSTVSVSPVMKITLAPTARGSASHRMTTLGITPAILKETRSAVKGGQVPVVKMQSAAKAAVRNTDLVTSQEIASVRTAGKARTVTGAPPILGVFMGRARNLGTVTAMLTGAA